MVISRCKIILLVLIVLFLLSFSIININAAPTFKYEWTNTKIDIPLGETVDKYKYYPKAILYKDNMALGDAQISYDTEGAWLYYFKNINTNKPGVYKVWYKAFESKYSPGTCINYKSLITFNVIDEEPPKLDIINKNINVRRGSSISLDDNINVTDNCDGVRYVITADIDFNKIGNYEVLVSAIDKSGNRVSDNFNVTVYETEKPIVTYLGNGIIKIPLKGDFNIREYFKATDVVDGDITNKIIFPRIYNDRLGLFDYELEVENNSGLKTIFPFQVEIIDDVIPKINLSTHNVILDYKEDFNTYDFTRYIRSITDNNEINYDNLEIKHNITNKIGNYIVNYSYTDGNFIAYETLDVSLVSHDAPIIEVSDILVNTKENVDLMNFINVIDPSDKNILSSVVIDDSNVTYEKEGTYYASVFCMNSSGLSQEKRFKIVVDNNSIINSDNLILFIVIGALGFLLIGIIIFGVIFYLKIRKRIVE